MNNNASGKDTISYVSLGDSYTAGHGATPAQAYPVLLAHALDSENVRIKLIANPAVGGYTTQNLIETELPVFDNTKPSFVTLLIGANDWVQGIDSATYRSHLVQILDHVESALPQKDHLVLITIPDVSGSPVGRSFANGRDIQKDLTAFNNIMKQEAGRRNLKVADVYPLSQEMHTHPEYIASDSLHPSALEYARWEQMVIRPVVLGVLGK